MVQVRRWTKLLTGTPSLNQKVVCPWLTLSLHTCIFFLQICRTYPMEAQEEDVRSKTHCFVPCPPPPTLSTEMTGGDRGEAQEIPTSADFTPPGRNELSLPPSTRLRILFPPGTHKEAPKGSQVLPKMHQDFLLFFLPRHMGSTIPITPISTTSLEQKWIPWLWRRETRDSILFSTPSSFALLDSVLCSSPLQSSPRP